MLTVSPFVIAPTYAVIKKSEHQRTDELHQTYWRLRGTTIISIDKHESLLPVLRQIQHIAPVAGQCPNWLRLAVAAIEQHDRFSDSPPGGEAEVRRTVSLTMCASSGGAASERTTSSACAR